MKFYYRRSWWRTRAPLRHSVFVIHEAVKKSVVGMKTSPWGFRAYKTSQPSQASRATLRKLERSVRRDVLRRLCNPREALPTFQISSNLLYHLPHFITLQYSYRFLSSEKQKLKKFYGCVLRTSQIPFFITFQFT